MAKSTDGPRELPLLAVSDKIEVLHEIVISDTNELNEELFGDLLEPYYDELIQFLSDIRNVPNVVRIGCAITRGTDSADIIFQTEFRDQTCRNFEYRHVNEEENKT